MGMMQSTQLRAEYKAAIRFFSAQELHWLQKTFKDLARRSKDKTIDRQTFLQYFPMPGMLGERLFNAFDRKRNGVIDYEEFICGLALIMGGSVESKASFLFELFNLADDEGVSRSEMTAVLASSLHAAADIVDASSFLLDKDDPAVAGGERRKEELIADKEAVHRLLVDDAFKGMHADAKLSKEEFQCWLQKNPTIEKSILKSDIFTLHENQMRKRASTIGTTSNTLRGHLVGVSRSGLRPYVRRYYVLKNHYLYKFAREQDTKPLGAYYLGGSYVSLRNSTTEGGKGTPRTSSTSPVGHYSASSLGTPGRQSQPTSPKVHSPEPGWITPHGMDSDSEDPLHLLPSPPPLLLTKTPQNNTTPRRSTTGSTVGIVRPNLEFGIEITTNYAKYKRVVYADDEETLQLWYSRLLIAAAQRDIDTLYVINESADLGSGAFATVHSAYSRLTDKAVAIKIIDKTTLDDEEKESLLSEIAVLKLAEHPHIVKLIDVFDTRTKLYLVMEMCKGGELVDMMEKGAMSEEDMGHIFTQLLRGLEYLHSLGIVHRDLKPNNILFDVKGEAAVLKMVDFGYSRFTSKPKEGFVDPAGTVKYWAPEVARGEVHSAPVDMWTVGVLLYIAVVGAHPFPGNDEVDVVKRIREGRYVATSPAYHALTDEMRGVIRLLLTTNPAKRMTATQLLNHPVIVRGYEKYRSEKERRRTMEEGGGGMSGNSVSATAQSIVEEKEEAVSKNRDVAGVGAEKEGSVAVLEETVAVVRRGVGFRDEVEEIVVVAEQQVETHEEKIAEQEDAQVESKEEQEEKTHDEMAQKTTEEEVAQETKEDEKAQVETTPTTPKDETTPTTPQDETTPVTTQDEVSPVTTHDEATPETTQDEATPETTHDETTQDEATQDEATPETTHDETTQDEATQDETTQDEATPETTHDETTQDEATPETTHDEATQDEATPETTRDETTQDETTQDETTQDETTQEIADETTVQATPDESSAANPAEEAEAQESEENGEEETLANDPKSSNV